MDALSGSMRVQHRGDLFDDPLPILGVRLALHQEGEKRAHALRQKTVLPPAFTVDAADDAGSAKQSVIRDAESVFGEGCPNFVAGHPIAGTEQSGVGAAFPELYRQRRVILTPTQDTRLEALDLVRDMWQAAGAEVETMSAEHHDLVLAGTSHLPHLLAYGLVDCLSLIA